jgi:uncharacterized protein with HEPN domain
VRDAFERLLDIQDAIARIMKYTRDGRYRFDHDELVQTWVTHNLYVIGEAAHAIANEFPEFRKQHPEIAWGDVIGMRTVIAHRYFDIDPNALWEAVSKDLQSLQHSIDAILAAEEGKQQEEEK